MTPRVKGAPVGVDPMRRYVYLGDRLTDPMLVGRECVASVRADGRCIAGRGAMLVVFDGEQVPRTVLRRRLRRRP